MVPGALGLRFAPPFFAREAGGNAWVLMAILLLAGDDFAFNRDRLAGQSCDGVGVYLDCNAAG